MRSAKMIYYPASGTKYTPFNCILCCFRYDIYDVNNKAETKVMGVSDTSATVGGLNPYVNYNFFIRRTSESYPIIPSVVARTLEAGKNT